MPKFIEQKVNGYGIIQKQEDGSLIQIGLTEPQYHLFELFLSTISAEKPLIKLPEEYNLTFKNIK